MTGELPWEPVGHIDDGGIVYSGPAGRAWFGDEPPETPPYGGPHPTIKPGDHVGYVTRDGDLRVERWRDPGEPPEHCPECEERTRAYGSPPRSCDRCWQADHPTGRRISAKFIAVDFNPVVLRVLFGIPPGFPLWYRPPRPMLPVGPIGRRMMRTQRFLQALAEIEAERWPLPANPLDPSAWFGDEGAS